MKLDDIRTPVTALSGVGPSFAKLFARLNIFTVADLLKFYPRSYENLTKRVPLEQFSSGAKVHTVAQVTAHDWFGYGRMRTLKLIISDGTASAALIAFNRQFLEKALPVGCIVAVTGSFSEKYGQIQSTAFDTAKIADSGDLRDFEALPVPNSGIFPVYPLTEGLNQKTVRKACASAVTQYLRGIENEVPDYLMRERALLPKQDAVRLIHRPHSMQEISDARRTLIYEELFLLQCAIAARTWRHKGFIPDAGGANAGADGTAVTSPYGGANAGAGAAGTGNAANPSAGHKAAAQSGGANAATPAGSGAANPQGGGRNNGGANVPPRTFSADSTAAPSAAAVTAPATPDAPRTDEQEFRDSLSPLQRQLLDRLNFSLTADQRRVISDMNSDIDRGYQERNSVLNGASKKAVPYTMARLLQGDVGSGKTLVAFFACLRVISWKGQCALMAPTEILARQHADSAAALLEPLGIRVAFLTGNVKAAGRAQLLKALKAGDIDIAVGTHALFSQQTVYRDLQLAVIDEQHRFGVVQRQSILNKGRTAQSPDGTAFEPHLLMMSATPIPQTLALTMFGDLDVSVIRTMPPGRKPVITYLVREGNERNAYDAVRRQLAAGRQAYFVYPAISPDERNAEIKSAEKMFEMLSRQVFPEYPCALIHSKISDDEQARILADFKSGAVKVLAATTVIEVGVDVPNAVCVVIEQADRFGLAQLHQIRGRVGRGGDQSYCFLIYSKNITRTGIERMKVLRQNTDGFVIADEDLKLRGPGEITGTVQAGSLALGIADIARDREILETARADAFGFMRRKLQDSASAADAAF